MMYAIKFTSHYDNPNTIIIGIIDKDELENISFFIDSYIKTKLEIESYTTISDKNDELSSNFCHEGYYLKMNRQFDCDSYSLYEKRLKQVNWYIFNSNRYEEKILYTWTIIPIDIQLGKHIKYIPYIIHSDDETNSDLEIVSDEDTDNSDNEYDNSHLYY